MSEKSWVHRIFFDAHFENALMRHRARTGLGSTYAILNALNEYWYEQGYMDEKGYQYHKERYGLPLVDEFEKQLRWKNQNTRMELIRKGLQIEQLTEKLTNAYGQWDTMKPEAQAWYLERAKENAGLPIAKKILKKIGQ